MNADHLLAGERRWGALLHIPYPEPAGHWRTNWRALARNRMGKRASGTQARRYYIWPSPLVGRLAPLDLAQALCHSLHHVPADGGDVVEERREAPRVEDQQLHIRIGGDRG